MASRMIASAERERGRLQALTRYRIDAATDSALDGLARLAALICATPIALITVIESAQQWTKARFGMQSPAIARELTFCTHAIEQDDVMIVPDARADRRFAENPLVVEAPRIRFYGGAPLVTDDGFRIGALCVMDTRPRMLESRQIESLRAIAHHVMTHLDLRRQVAAQQAVASTALEQERLRTFASTVSHELRTPITSIRGSIALLAAGHAGPLPPEARKMLAVAERNSVRLVGFIEGMLNGELERRTNE
jgi:GAF domain-containing protein